MVVQTDSPRVRTSRRLVLELLGSSVDLSTAPDAQRYSADYGAQPERFGEVATVAQPAKLDNDLYMRDYSKCILCYKCVEACGVDHQNTFAIAVAGRGFEARISTEFDVTLPSRPASIAATASRSAPPARSCRRASSSCGRRATWDESKQSQVDTVCPYCGVGCNLTLHVQDDAIVKVSSPDDHDVTRGNLCIKGRFGYEFVQNRK